MADRATQIVNFYESTLAASLIGASGVATTTLSQAPTTDGTSTISASSGDEDTWYYLVVDPDTSGTREVIVVKASSGTSITEIGRDVEGRYAATSLPEHTAGTTVRMAALAEHIKDQNDRVTTNISSLQSALNTFTNTDAPAAIQGIQDDYDALNLQGQFNSYQSSTTSAINTALASKPSLGLVIALS